MNKIISMLAVFFTALHITYAQEECIPPTNVSAGTNMPVVCGSIYILQGSAITPGNTGKWTVSPNYEEVIIADPANPNSPVNVNNIFGTYVFRWTEYYLGEETCYTSADVTITFHQEYDATLTPEPNRCMSASPFEIQAADYGTLTCNASPGNCAGLTGNVFNPLVAGPGTYTITNFFNTISHPCASPSSSSITFTIHDEIVVTNVSESCGAAGNPILTVSFDVSTASGLPVSSYTVNDIVQTGSSFSQTPAPDNYSYIVADMNGCSEVTVSGYRYCDCPLYAGTMSTLETQILCQDECIENLVTHNGDQLYADDEHGVPSVFEYVIYRSNGLGGTTEATRVSSLSQVCQSTLVAAGVFSYNTIYYITPVMGYNLNGHANLNNACRSTTSGTPVMWQASPYVKAGDDQIVYGKKVRLNANEVPWGMYGYWTSDKDYSLNGGSNNYMHNPIVTVPEYGEYVFTWNVVNGQCTSSDDVTVTFKKNLPTTDLFFFDLTPQPYDGIEKQLSIKTKADVFGLGDITIKYDGSDTKPVNAGIYAVTVDILEGANYSAVAGLLLGNLEITAKGIDDVTITADAIADQTYTGNDIEPLPIVKDGTSPLAEGTDYTLSYSNNVDVGTATVILTGTGNYNGTKEITFEIIAKDIDDITITADAIADRTYTGSVIEPLPVVKDGSVTLQNDIDYELSYSNNINAGTATVTIAGTGNYGGTKEITFEITAKDIDDITITADAISDQTYTGSVIEPLPVVKDGSATLQNDTDYELSYSNNINVGTATLTITGTGNYGGTRTVSFVINKLSSVAPPSLPEGLEATYGDRFRDVSLPSGFTWPNPSSAVGNASSSPVSVTALYNPDPSKYEDYIVVLQLMIHPAQPPREIIFPEADMTATISYDPEQTLSDIGLINGSGAGTFSWRYPNTVPTVDRTGYEVVFTPADTDNYDYSGVEGWNARTRTITRTISLTIVPRDIAIDLFCDAAKTYTGLPVELCEAEVTVSPLRSSTAESIALEYLYYRNGLLQDEAINAGVYEVFARSADVNYSGQSATVSFTIEKAQPFILVNDTVAVYTGEAIAIAYEITGTYTAPGLSRTLRFTYEGINGTSYGPTETAPAEIGEYSVHLYTPGSVNHLEAEAKATLKIVSGVGIDQVASETFRIYPNPVSKNSKLFLEVESGKWKVENGQCAVEVYDTNGSLLRKIEVKDSKMEIRSENKEGIYLYVIKSDAGVETVKVVVK